MEGIVLAARNGDAEEVERLVLVELEDVNTVAERYSLTALHVASLHGFTDIVKFLLSQGARTDVLDDWRCTPLHNAAGAGHVEIVHALCEAGARMDIRSANKGKTALEVARDKGKFDVIPVIQASYQERLCILQIILY